jgi:hypothetical protein
VTAASEFTRKSEAATLWQTTDLASVVLSPRTKQQGPHLFGIRCTAPAIYRFACNRKIDTGCSLVGAVYDRPQFCNGDIVGGHRPPLQKKTGRRNAACILF